MEIRTTRPVPSSLSPIVCSHSYVSTTRLRGKADKLVKQRYTAMADASKQMNDDNLLGLPRVQVNVAVAPEQFQEFDSGSDLVEFALPNVLQKLQEIAIGGPRGSSTRSAQLEQEGVCNLELKADMSLREARQPTSGKLDFSSTLSPEKTGTSYAMLKRLQPSPARKLVLGSTAESEEEEEDDESAQVVDVNDAGWRLTSYKKLSEMSVMCVVDMSTRKAVLNITFSVLDRQQPASPTTGVRMPHPSCTLIAQMSTAKSGSALLAVRGGLLSVGGFTSKGVLDSTEFYDAHFNCWDDRGSLDTKRARFAAVECEGSPYIIGGSDGRDELGSIEVFNSKSLTWGKVSTRMITPRSCFDAATFNGRIYAVGGVYYSTPLKSAEVYDPTLKKWRAIPPMHTSRYGLCVSTCRGKVYAIGGQTLGWNCLSLVECYDPTTASWSKVASMKTPRRNATSVSVDGKIYVIGGYNGSTAVNLVEMYDPRENVWKCLSPMKVKRSSASSVHLDGAIYVAGGYSGSTFLNSIEKYDIGSGQWSSTA